MMFGKSHRFLKRHSLIFVSLLLLNFGCVTYIPVDEYAIARAAFENAKEADAARFAPALWFSAEQAYREAEKAFRERRYGDAQSAFVRAKESAEKAENAARLSRHESGEIIP